MLLTNGINNGRATSASTMNSRQLPSKEVAAFEQMTVGQLQDRYIEVLGEPVRSRHRKYLIPPGCVAAATRRPLTGFE